LATLSRISITTFANRKAVVRIIKIT
jgi:hypothetical protein